MFDRVVPADNFYFERGLIKNPMLFFNFTRLGKSRLAGSFFKISKNIVLLLCFVKNLWIKKILFKSTRASKRSP